MSITISYPLLATGAVVAAIGFAAPALADVNDETIIQTLDDYGLQYGSADKAILMAKTVCSELAAGEALSDVIERMAENTTWSNDDTAFFTGAAVQTYCPQYAFMVPTTIPSVPVEPILPTWVNGV